MVRNYLDQSVPDDKLDRVAAAALRAPSAGNSQALAVVVATDPKVRLDLAILADEPGYVRAGFDPWISRAPAHVVIAVSELVYRNRYAEPDKLGPGGEEISWPVPYWWVDAGAALMAVLLAAVDEGLAAGFLGVHATPELARVLGFPDDYSPIGIVTLGYPAPDRRSGSLDRPRKGPNQLIRRDRWS